jgi:hypothetical protein
MAKEPQIRAWKWIEPPFIPFITMLAEMSIVPLAFGGWTTVANVTAICVAAVAFIAWFVVRTRFYKKHKRVIVARELDTYKDMVKNREYFLANNKWPDKAT